MKICPKCQQQFPNGFQYCPNDTEYLITNEEHVRRTRPMASTPAPESVELPPVSVVPIAKAPPEVIAPQAPIRPVDPKLKEGPVPSPPRGVDPIRPIQTEPEARFPITLYVDEVGDDLSLRLVYQRALFSDERIASMLRKKPTSGSSSGRLRPDTGHPITSTSCPV